MPQAELPAWVVQRRSRWWNCWTKALLLLTIIGYAGVCMLVCVFGELQKPGITSNYVGPVVHALRAYAQEHGPVVIPPDFHPELGLGFRHPPAVLVRTGALLTKEEPIDAQRIPIAAFPGILPRVPWWIPSFCEPAKRHLLAQDTAGWQFTWVDDEEFTAEMQRWLDAPRSEGVPPIDRVAFATTRMAR